MPSKTNLDTVYTLNFDPFGGRKYLVVVPKFTLPLWGKHYYRINIYDNNKKQTGFFLGDNLMESGQVSAHPLIDGQGAAIVEKGDIVNVYMRWTDEPVYNYFNTLLQNTNLQSTNPTNPISNINNGALGYFSANTIQLYTFVPQ